MTGKGGVSVIIGAGLGGVSAVRALREAGNTGRIILINGEDELPYDRPPLSKGVLRGEAALPDIYLQAEAWYRENDIEILSGVRAEKIRPDSHQVDLSNGASLDYSKLLIASGADARRIPALHQDIIPYHYLRTYQDTLALQSHLVPGQHLVLIGAGVIGLEVAASALKCGCRVSVVEIADRVMARSIPQQMSAWLQQQHEARGVKFYLENSVKEFREEGGSPGLALQSGDFLPADVMLICAGVIPAVELAEQCGIHCDNGVVVNEFGETSVADIYAIGDVACYPDAWLGRQFRSENWMHARRHAECTARNMNGDQEPYTEIQSVWTDQFEFKLQIAGVLEGDREVLRGDMNSDSFMIFFLDKNRVIGVLGVNQAKFMRIGQNLIKSKAEVDVDALADVSNNLKRIAS